MKRADWASVKAIYEEGIATKNATFESQAPEWKEWDKRHLKKCRFIALNGDQIVGWAALCPISERCIYSGVAEVSVYVSSSFMGKGAGSLLLKRLIEESEDTNIWTLQAGIFPENHASINLHKKHGFREVGTRERIGMLDGIWRDVILFERRRRKD